ncbi:hypothetical protein ROHU_025577 [Labeo rohita]|uniref:Uncharacterized protein n=1 Tax=Labeo rohita TaxID=84645 RepID=A0A498MK52_LABRO|nr:hypothetical protein ROHU_025577 [Labeo rohita]
MTTGNKKKNLRKTKRFMPYSLKSVFYLCFPYGIRDVFYQKQSSVMCGQTLTVMMDASLWTEFWDVWADLDCNDGRLLVDRVLGLSGRLLVDRVLGRDDGRLLM